MFHLQQLPKRLAIVGGGYIGVEFSSMMNALGVQVTLVDRDEQILSGFGKNLANLCNATKAMLNRCSTVLRNRMSKLCLS